MKLAQLKQRAAVGSEVSLLVSGGTEIKGRIIRFEESLVVVSQDGRERMLFEESITGFELLSQVEPKPPTDSSAAPQIVPEAPESLRPAGPKKIEKVGYVQLPLAPRPGNSSVSRDEAGLEGQGSTSEHGATLTWARALDYVDEIRRTLAKSDQPSDRTLGAAKEFANEFIKSPSWVHRDPNVRYFIIQAFKAIERYLKQREADSSDTLMLSQALVALNRALLCPSGVGDEELFVDLYHFYVAVRTHLEHYRRDDVVWRELGASMREAYRIGANLLNRPNFHTLWEREPHRQKVFFHRLSEVCNALLTCGFALETERERLIQRANEYSVIAGGQPTPSETESMAMGAIVSFGGKQYGFIQARNQQELFFTLRDVVSETIRARLMEGNDQLEIEVDFDQEAQPGKPRAHAIKIRQPGFFVCTVKRLPFLEKPEYGFLELSDGREAHFPFTALQAPFVTPKVGDAFLCHVVRQPKGWTADRMESLATDAKPQEPVPDEHETSDKRIQGPSRSNGRPDRTVAGGNGRITSFGNQGFGFIDTRDGRTLFFRIEDVVDNTLHQQLLDPALPIGAEVVFKEEERRYGQRYDRAITISLAGADQLLKRAMELGSSKQFREALEVVRTIQRLLPESTEALELGRDLQHKLIRAEKLPADDSAFARAKRAWVLDQDFDGAERLYRVAISRGERLEAAVKDLASLLQQMKRGNEAIELLEQHSKRPDGHKAFDGMLATSYEHAQRHDKALGVLCHMERSANHLARPVILRRIAFAHFRLKQFDLAEQALGTVLDLRPTDAGAERLLAVVQEAKGAGSAAKADELIAAVGELADYSGGLSPLAEMMLKECSFEGVAPNKVESGNFVLRDALALIDLARALGTKRPRERAAYYLSAAAIFRKLQDKGERVEKDESVENRLRGCLRIFFQSMGDATWAEKKHLDSVRTYFTESLALSDELSEGDCITLRDYLVSHASPAMQDTLSRLPLNPSEALVRVWQDLVANQGTAESVFRGVIHLSVQSRVAVQTLWEATKRNRSIFEAFANYLGCGKPASQKDAQDKLEQRRTWLAEHLRKLDVSCEALTKVRLTTASFEDLVARLRGMDREILCDLDRQRLTALSLVAEDALSFCRAADFEERERHYFTLKIGADKLSKEIKDAPTKFSFESLLAVVKHLGSLVEESYADLALTSVPEIRLGLVNDSYVPNRGKQGDEVTLQLQISNRTGCSPASNIELQVGPDGSDFFSTHSEFLPIVDSLRGGRTTDRHWHLRVTQAAKEQRAFPVTVRARFQNSMGQKVTAPGTQFTVRLYPESEFQPIENPYAPVAHSGAVKSPKMFFGRDEFINQICSSLLAPGETKSILIYGQKRAGKTSVLDHLKLKLSTLECLPVKFSLQAIGAFTQTDFLYRLLQEIRDTVQNESLTRGGALALDLPDIRSFESHPAILFHECLGQFLHKCRATEQWQDLRLILLIDEFTDIFSGIQRQRIPREFMKLWKAIIEKGYFSCVLVGKDIMPAFKKEFPNELGVTDPKRITYLADRYARDLIEIPIGSERYKSNAVGRLLQLTAGSPFYTMMFCDKLVEYMNRTRSLVVTEADIEKVKESLISGDDFLSKDEFDPLYSAGEGKVDTGIDPDATFLVCTAMAKKSEKGGWCSTTSLMNLTPDLDEILLDLKERDVLERKGDSYRIKVGLFREWLLVNA